MSPNRVATIVVALAFCCAGGAYAKKKKKAAAPSEPVAKADIAAKSGSKLTGTATFTKNDKGELVVKIDVADAPPGEHAVHIHEKGDCSSPDGKSAGDHWNPTHMEHGKWGAPGEHFHLGDIGNLKVGADGKGTITLATSKWSAGSGEANDVIGHAIVVHGGVDDYKTQPSGNAGPRIGCGVIVK